MTEPSASPGWYDQPDGSRRYWDGAQWTEQVVAAPSADATAESDGIRWLGATWGRGGRPQPARRAGIAFAVGAVAQFVLAIVASASGSSVGALIAVTGAVTALGAVAFFIDAHFAARVARGQR